MPKRLPRSRTLKGEPKLAYYDSRGVSAGTGAGANSGEPPIVLAHGVTSRSEDWENIFPRLATRYRVIAYDGRGHGKSGRAESYTLIERADDLIRILREIAKAPAVVIGHSLGALTAFAAAGREPSLFRALVLEDPPLTPLVDAAWSYFGAVEAALAKVSDPAAFKAAVSKIPLPVPGPRGERTIGEVRGFYSSERLVSYFTPVDPRAVPSRERPDVFGREALVAARPSCPILLLVGDTKVGGMLGEEGVERIGALPDVTVVRFPGIGHRIHGLRPEPFLEALEPFLRRVRAS